MLPIVLFICTLVSFCVLSPNKVFACSCGEVSVQQRFELSSVVFTGTLVTKDKEGGNIFSIDKVWKGNLADGYVYSGFSGMCGTEFEKGNKYLVYTESLKGKESTGLCSGNKLIAEASKDIRDLNYLLEPERNNKYLLFIIIGFTCAIVISFVIMRDKLRFEK